MGERIESVAELEERLSAPPASLVEMMGRVEGDVLILGAGGKMGPTLARMARRAADQAGDDRRVTAVSRFSNPEARAALEAAGVETIAGDLLDPGLLDRLPDAPNIVYMPGVKFGTSGDAAKTWAINACLPGMVCRRFAGRRIMAFSTGNVYPLTPVESRGSKETDPLGPIGEYAHSAMARERIFAYFSRAEGTPVAVVRLNYACELRYGVLVDLAQQVLAGEPIDLTMGYLNAIWQGDANATALRALEHAATPPFVINVAGPEVLSVRTLAEQFAERFDKPVRFEGQEAPDALLSDSRRAVELFGPPAVGLERMLDWIADWLRRGGETLGKATHFEVRDGAF